jgi:hypothetical protein
MKKLNNMMIPILTQSDFMDFSKIVLDSETCLHFGSSVYFFFPGFAMLKVTSDNCKWPLILSIQEFADKPGDNDLGDWSFKTFEQIANFVHQRMIYLGLNKRLLPILNDEDKPDFAAANSLIERNEDTAWKLVGYNRKFDVEEILDYKSALNSLSDATIAIQNLIISQASSLYLAEAKDVPFESVNYGKAPHLMDKKSYVEEEE